MDNFYQHINDLPNRYATEILKYKPYYRSINREL